MKKLADSIRVVGLVANPEKPRVATVVRRAARILRGLGHKVLCDAATSGILGADGNRPADLHALAGRCDLLLVFGGDGTMLRVARETAAQGVPILGVNAGNLGFLTAVPATDLRTSLAKVAAGRFRVEERDLLEATIRRGGEETRQTALNDFVLSRGLASRLIELEVSVNGEILTRYRCDGLIASSPTGSTAYSLAAGGAIVSPDAHVLMLTPICPHTLSIRPVVVNLESVVTVKTLSRRLVATLAADGQQQVELGAGDTVVIRRSPHPVRLLRPDGTTFFSTLRAKFAWSGTNL